MFLDTIQECLKRQIDADYTQALLNCCLKNHFDIIVADQDLMLKVKAIKQVTVQRFSAFEDMLAENICMISHFTGVQISN